jgi:polysaccharide biosynthesis/export protein
MIDGIALASHWRARTSLVLGGTLVLLLLCHCARYPSIPELKGEIPAQVSRDSGRSQIEERMRTILSGLQKSDDKEYVIGPKDVLEITVWQHPEMTAKMEVPAGGAIRLPLIGEITANGKSVSQMEKEISAKLDGRFIIDPQVSVTVVDYKSKSVYILGETRAWGGTGVGRYPLRGRTTLIELLTEAGLSQEAGTECIVVRPRGDAATDTPTLPGEAQEGQVFRVDITDLMSGDLVQNIELQNGDTVYIPKAQNYFVFGEVKTPGKYKFEKGTTVLKAITTAGGTTEKAASLTRTKILRDEDGKKVRISVKPTDTVRPGDTIIVPESFF